MRRKRWFWAALVAVLSIFGQTSSLARENVRENEVALVSIDNETSDPIANYEKSEVMVPMRDGVKLYTAIYAPKDKRLVAPIIIVRTPYSLAPYNNPESISLGKCYNVFLKKNYILVFQNVRGTMMSEGQFEEIRPLEKKFSSRTDDATDSYDTVEWLLENTTNNGNVGFLGTSYNGFYATVAAMCGHPAIKAVSPQAPIGDWFMGDDAHINGAFLNTVYTFGARQFRNRPVPVSEALPPVVRPTGDYYDYFLDKGPLSNLFKDFGDSLSFFNEIQNHPNYDAFWQSRCPLSKMKELGPAFLVVGGWFDREDFYGTLNTYQTVRRLSPKTDAYLVLGPWAHGSWNNLSYNHLGDAWFGEGSSRYFNEHILFRFFDRYLRERFELQLPKVHYFPIVKTDRKVMEGVVSDNLWKTAESWPLPSTKVSYYLGNHKDLRKTAVRDKEGKSSYFSSPSRPVRCVGKEMTSWASDQVTGDQSYLTWRSDLLTFTGSELQDTLKVVGPVTANLSVSLSTTDADLVVKLIDVRPDGYQMLVRWSVLPLRFRNSFSEPKAVVPGEVMDVRIDMNDIAHYFLPGHKLMVQIQSSMFPWLAMNPQTFLENPYKAVRKDYRQSEITIYTNRNHQSFISLPVVE